jgi:hypothetical protein
VPERVTILTVLQTALQGPGLGLVIAGLLIALQLYYIGQPLASLPGHMQLVARNLEQMTLYCHELSKDTCKGKGK